MNKLIGALKTVRGIELLALAALMCILIVLCMGNQTPEEAALSEEGRVERLLSRIEGAGSVTVMMRRDNATGEVVGVVVAATGADEIKVVLELQRAVRALTGLEVEKIEIIKSGR